MGKVGHRITKGHCAKPGISVATTSKDMRIRKKKDGMVQEKKIVEALKKRRGGKAKGIN